jgi:heavy metal translocating P-type ATPase
MPHPKTPHIAKTTSTPSAAGCDLCGLPLRAGNHAATHADRAYRFCCQGCRQVFNILIEASDAGDPANFRHTELFKQCQELGIIPRSAADLLTTDSEDQPAGDVQPSRIEQLQHSSKASIPPENTLSLNLKISNMWCPACAWLIDESLKKTRGIIDSTCNFSTDRLQVNYNPVKTSPDRIISAVKKIGYRAAEPDQTRDALERRREFVRFAVSAFLTMNIMMLSYGLYSGFFTEFSRETIYKLSWPAFIMATAVIAYGGFELLTKAWSGLSSAAFSMESLIIIGSLSAYIYSTANLLAGSIHVYYDTAAMLITLVLLGKALERRAKGRVLEGLENFFSLKPAKVRICTDDYPAGRYVSAEVLKKEDIFRIDENEIVPADGRVVDGTGMVDESSLTGEPLPVRKRPGDTLRSGTSVISGTFKARAQKVGEDSTLGQMLAIIEQTLMTKTPLEGKTDAILQWFVPVIVALSAGTAVICAWAGISTEDAILRAVTVLVISCPCALGIAIPLARVAGISIAGKKGLLVRDFKAFEQADNITAVVFDKTGTITTGKWNLLETACREPYTAHQVLALAAGLEVNSEHFIGTEILRRARAQNLKIPAVSDIQAESKGIRGRFEGQEIKIGSAEFLAGEISPAKDSVVPSNLTDRDNQSYVYLSVNGCLAATFIFGDEIRADSRRTVKQLQDRGLRLALISGDGEHTTRSVAEMIGISTAFGGRMPRDKSDFIIELQHQKHQVAMVGDGINDAPALVQADLSIAVHSGGQLTREAADITLMRGEPSQLIDFLNFAKQVNRKIYQNLIFTYLYNVLAIPIAMSGLLNPLVAVVAMLLSSLSVTGNTLMLVRRNTRPAKPEMKIED